MFNVIRDIQEIYTFFDFYEIMSAFHVKNFSFDLIRSCDLLPNSVFQPKNFGLFTVAFSDRPFELI